MEMYEQEEERGRGDIKRDTETSGLVRPDKQCRLISRCVQRS